DTDWVNRFEGKRIVRGYRKRFGVNILCAITELRMLGVHISQEYEEQARRSVEDAAEARRKRKAERKELDTPGDILECDETFSYIAGYTPGGVPFGVTWEQWDPNEDCSLNTENDWSGTDRDDEVPF
ncbi:MAG: hypothetical protein V5A74_09930, partial [Desulfohalobiaceae bacterium]